MAVYIQAAIAYCASLDGIRTSLDGLVEAPWLGVSRAKSVIQLFELLIATPESAGWLRELGATDKASSDWQLIEEWITRYRHSIEQYGRWARDCNRALGEKVFREHFL